MSVQFAADMETCTGCNEEEGFTLLHLVSECQRVAQFNIHFCPFLHYRRDNLHPHENMKKKMQKSKNGLFDNITV